DARLKALWGLPPEAHVDHTVWLSGMHPEDRPRVEAAAAAAIDPAGDGLYTIEYRVIGINDGVERWVSTHGRTTFENGRAVGFIGAVREITDRKRAEARLAAILEQLPVGVALFDRAGRIKLANRIFGPYALDYIPSVNHRESQRWRSYTPEGQLLDRSEYPGARALRGETVVPGTDFLFTSPDGRERWTRQSAAPFRNAAHDVVGAVTVVQDIDREKRAEHTLRESEERFRQFAEHMMDVLWIADAETMQLEYLNPAFERVWGEPRKAMLRDGSGWPQFLHPEDRERALSAVPRVLQGEVVVQEYRIVRADGRVRWIRDTGFPIPDGGAVERIGGIAQDLTRQDGSLVYVVNEDDEARASATHLLHGAGYEVQAFASAKALLARAPALVPGCVVLTVDTSEPSGLSIPRELKARHLSLPVIVTGKSHGDIGFGVRAMKAGAVDFLEMPYEDDALLTAIASAQADIRDLAERDRAAEAARMRIASLSARERQVLDGLLAGGTNKSIARQLGISPRTVEAHRAHVMEQLGARTLPEAVLLAAAAGLQPPPPLDDTDEP
ncbi:MAG TPA: PAS domain S-box protein, partial [Stenotrophomonas sp.]